MNTFLKKDFKNKKSISFLFESPEMIESDFDNQFYAPAIYYFDHSKKLSFITFTEFFCLDDRFCTMPVSNYDFSSRSNQILYAISSKNLLPGHKKRIVLKNNASKNPDFLEVNFAKRKVNDLYEIYKKFKFVVVIENCDKENYTSEKFYDVIKSGAIPIYHKIRHHDFIYCYLDYDRIVNPVEILKEIKLFSEKYDLEKISNQNFNNLEVMRENLKVEYFKYLAYPFYALSSKIHAVNPLFKLIMSIKRFFK